jgi:hypothetical protein
VLVLLVKRQFRAAAVAVATAVGLALASVPATGAGIWRTWLVDVLPHQQSSGNAAARNQTFGGFFDRLLTHNGVVASFGNHPSLARALATACAVALVLAGAWLVRRPVAPDTDRFALEYALFLVIGIVATQKSFEHYAVFLLPAYALGFAALYVDGRLPERARDVVGIAMAISYVTWAFLLQTGTDYQALPHGRLANPLYSAKFFATLVLAGCVWRILRALTEDRDDLYGTMTA